MELCAEHFTHGVKNIITGHSPGDPPGECDLFRSSTHPQREFFYVLAGNSRYMLNGKIYDAIPGTFFLIDYWEPHAFGYSQKDHDLLHLWMHISNHGQKISGNFLTVERGGEFHSLPNPVRLPLEYEMMLSHRWDALLEEKSISQEKIIRYLKSPLEAFLDELSLFLFNTRGILQETDNSDNVIEPLKRYIRMCNARECSLKHLEKVSGYSRYYLAHQFKEYEGCTIGEYIDKIRIQYTIEAMKRGLRQKEISFELGFSSPSNFWIWLRKHKNEINSVPFKNTSNEI